MLSGNPFGTFMFPRRSLRSTARTPIHSAKTLPPSPPPLLQAITQTLNYIDAHLDDPLALSSLALAEQASLPAHYFDTLFHLCMGQTPQDYFPQRRLEMAALLLTRPETVPILKIARALGFTAANDFSEAFQAHFGDTPSRWRSQQTPEAIAALTASTMRQPTLPPLGAFSLTVTLEKLPSSRVAYFRHIGPYGPALGTFWRNTVLPWMGQMGLNATTCFGIAHDDPSITPDHACRYDAAIEVSETQVISSPAGIAHLPGGHYAVAEYRGDPSGLATAWTRFFQAWLPNSPYLPDARPCFERYAAGTFSTPDRDAFHCQLCIPVKRPL